MRTSGNSHFILLTGIANRITAEAIPLTLTLCFLSLLFQFTPFLQAENNEVGAVTFNRDIRPILSDNCLACHGPDEKSRKADLRLDTEEGATMDLGGYKAVDPGNLEKSELLKRIFTEDLDDVMPPPESNKSLTEEEKQKIQAWIHQGAVWENHWSFIPVKRPYVFDSSTFHWGINPIDYFIQDRLDKESLPHSPTADRITLLRRVSLDLTGLPQSLAELDIFLADRSPSAYENLVDRLLQSSAYGEHMARYWLDAVRYGDTHGLHLDNYREIWPYRDWVIGAFNDNMPYDQFITEQLAGDLLPDPTDDQMVATGYNRCHVTTNEGGSIREEVYVRNVVDRVVNFGTVFMGMTLECTRCHDHKFDPFTMDDFYSMFAYFNSLDGSPLDGNRKDPAPVIKLPDATQKQELEEYDKLITNLENRLKSPWPEIDQLQETWEKERTTALSSSARQPVAEDLTLGDWYAIGPFSDVRRYLYKRKHGPEGKPVNLSEEFKLATGETITWKKRPDWKDGVPHSDLPGQTAANFIYRTIESPKDQKVPISLGSDDGIKVYLNEKSILSKDVSREVAADQEQIELSLKQGTNHLLLKIMNYGGESGFYFSLKSGGLKIPEEIDEIIRLTTSERTPDQTTKLREFYRNKVANSEQLEQIKTDLKEHRKKRADVDRDIPTSLVWREKNELVPAYILTRGEYDQKGKEVSRRNPSSLPAMNPDLPNDRLGLARWLLSPEHPLTSRVYVNRLWQQVFGTGLVKTSEDFGSQGEPPSHPELLDWLASELMENGWNTKAIMKKLVMSATYRQSAKVTQELLDLDPDNRLYARGPRFRLDGEMLRDQALLLGGLLSKKLGGPSVKPPQPDGLWFSVGYSGSNTVRFVADEGHEKVHRRSIYTFIKRTSPPPQMSTFDGPSREASCVRRERTSTPLQALLLLNDPQYIEVARGLAKRALNEAGHDDTSRAAYLFRICTGRFPNNIELEDLLSGFNADLKTYRDNPKEAGKFLNIDPKKDPQLSNPAEWAAWTLTANLLLNLDEVVMKN